MKLHFIIFLFLISIVSLIKSFAQGNIEIYDSNPRNSPILILSDGIGIGSTPHFYINPLNHLDLHLNLRSYTSFNLKYDRYLKFWDTEFKDKYVTTSSDNPIKTYRNIDFTWNVSFFSRIKKESVPLFSHQENTGPRSVNRYFYSIVSDVHRHLDVTLGFIFYRDVIGLEKYEFVSKDGYIIDDSHLNIKNKVFQIGLTYNKDIYLRARYDGRNLQTIKTRSIYLLLLYGPNTNIDPVLFNSENRTYEIDLNESEIKLRKVGFKTGVSVNRTAIGSIVGLRYGGELALFPGIKGFPNDYLNLSARFYVQVSLNLLKKNGDKWQI